MIWGWALLWSCTIENVGGAEDEDIEVAYGDSHSVLLGQIVEETESSGPPSPGIKESDIVHYTWIQTRGQKIEVPFQFRSGYAVMDGDVLLGGQKELTGHARSVVRVYRPWTCSTIFYRFSTDENLQVDGRNRHTTRMAIRHFENQTGLKFVYLPIPSSQENYIEIRQWEQSWGNSYVGMRGGKQELNLPTGASLRLVIHELGHAVGLSHEHQHPQRDRYVFFDEECVKPSQKGNFRLQTEVEFSDFYDFASVMHYKSSGFCMNDIEDRDKDGKLKECGYQPDDPLLDKCYPLLRLAGECPERSCEDRDGDGFREYVRGGERLSAGDIAAIGRLYKGLISHREIDQAEAFGEGFGKSMVVGDFDGDSISDVAIGAPLLSTELRPDRVGKVIVYRGHSAGFVRCRELEAQDFDLDSRSRELPVQSSLRLNDGESVEQRMPNAGAKHRFGAALAIADFDHDGIDDLVVASTESEIANRGTPGPGYSETRDSVSGAVYVYRSSELEDEDERKEFGGPGPGLRGVRLRPWLILDSGWWDGEPQQQDHFGFALSSGDLDGDGWRDDLVIGAPTMDGETVVQSGSAMIVYGEDQQLEIGERLGQHWVVSQGSSQGSLEGGEGTILLPVKVGHENRGDEFGRTIEVGDVDGDLVDEVFVGAPCDRVYAKNCSGSVFVFGRGSNGLSARMRIDQKNLAHSEAGDRFGQSIALLDLNEDGRKELLVGAPGEDIERSFGKVDRNAGYVFAIRVGRNGYQTEPAITIPWWEYVGPGAQLGRFMVSIDTNAVRQSAWKLWVGAASNEVAGSKALFYGWKNMPRKSRGLTDTGTVEALLFSKGLDLASGVSALAHVLREDREYLLIGAPQFPPTSGSAADRMNSRLGQVYVFRVDRQPIELIARLRSDRSGL